MLAGAVATCPGPVRAETDATASLASIERHIKALQTELAALRASDRARAAETAAATRQAMRAQDEAREALRRANAEAAEASASNERIFTGSAIAGPESLRGSRGEAQAVALNGLGGHEVGTAGQQKASALGDFGRFQLGGVSVTLGGYIDATAIERSRNEVADVSSSWNTIPFPQSPLYHEPEFRGTARNSRFALLVQGQPTPAMRVAGYVETDFKTAGVSSNSNESNSYALSLRLAYATVDRSDLGLHVLAGQNWSLLTLNRIGITPRQEQIPLTIDSAYVPGFTWTRNWQFRIAKDFFERKLWAGLSFESPQTLYSVGNANSTGVVGGFPNYNNLGGSLLNSTANYTDEIAPDVIAKVAFDPSFGHYEIYGVARFPHDRVTPTIADRAGRDNTVLAGGGGAAFVLPLAGPALTLQASTLVGQGIGRYGEGQLPDETIGSNGNPVPLPEIQALVGLVAHPVRTIDLFAYVGSEQAGKRSFNETVGGVRQSFGYGNGYYSDAGCETEGSPLACVANTRGLTQGTLGAWWRFAHGNWGTLQTGAQYSYTRRDAFSGTGARAGTSVRPSTDENIVMFSFRYLPFL